MKTILFVLACGWGSFQPGLQPDGTYQYQQLPTTTFIDRGIGHSETLTCFGNQCYSDRVEPYHIPTSPELQQQLNKFKSNNR